MSFRQTIKTKNMKKLILSIIISMAFAIGASAQCTFRNTAFESGESLTYNVYYNWKFVWVKAGSASMSVYKSYFKGKDAYRASLVTRGNDKADKMFVLRDTLLTYCTPELVPLYFRKASLWSSPAWQDQTRIVPLDDRHIRQRELLRTRNRQKTVSMIGPLVFPGEYVAYEVVEQLFKTCRSFNFFMCTSRESDVESQGGTISRLSIPMQEMRQYKKELCKEMFGVESLRTLHTEDRLRLARALRTKYNSSVKQIARLCGLVYAEVKDRI